MEKLQIIQPRSSVAFKMKKGQRLKVVDYAETIFLTKNYPLYSNRSNIMFQIVEDTVGRHDFLLTPCSSDTFRIIYGHTKPHRGCFGNLSESLEPYGIAPDQIPVCFNIFMNVEVDGRSGKISVLPPKSKAGDFVVLEACMDLIVGMTACSAEMSNNYAFKPIGYHIGV